MTERIVDARGLRCPWPALRLAKAMREADRVAIKADDPQAAHEIAALAAEQGWRFQHRAGDFLVEKCFREVLN